MDAARELAQLGERHPELLGQVVHHGGRLGVAQASLEQPQVEGERDELLLGPVVQVALDPPARGVPGLHDAHARDAQILHPGPQVRLQALVVERERGRRGGGLDELGARVELRVVEDGRHPDAVALHRRPRPARARVGQRHGMAGLVDEDLPVRQPVGDGEGPVAEALGQQLADRPAGHRLRGEQEGADEPPQRLAGGDEPRDGQDRHGDGQEREGHAADRARSGRARRTPARRSPRAPSPRARGARPRRRGRRAPRRRARRRAAAWWPGARAGASAPRPRAARRASARASRAASSGRAARGCARRAGCWRRAGRARRPTARPPPPRGRAGRPTTTTLRRLPRATSTSAATAAIPRGTPRAA
jgi:hypothetical protein